MYNVKDQIDRGNPTSEDPIVMIYQMEIEGLAIDFHKPVIYKSSDPVMGEQFRPVEIIPAAAVSID